MTYQEWAGEYLQSAETLKNQIADLKAQREFAPVDELQRINNRIRIMYGMYLDCMHTAKHLSKRKGIAF